MAGRAQKSDADGNNAMARAGMNAI